MSKTNKIICYVVACIMLICVAVLMFGCKDNGKTDQTKVMNVSVNPEVEFILDKDNKVVSVSAANDEGNFIVAKATFEGLTAQDAAKLFVQVSNENGFVANVGDIEIEISGNQAQNIFNSVKSNVEAYLSQEGINIHVTLDKIDRDDLEDMLEDCMKELKEEEIEKLTNDEIIAKIKEMRDQTKDLNTEKLKEMYYQFREQEIEKARFNAYIEEIKKLIIPVKDQIVGYYTNLTQAIDSLQDTFIDYYLSQASDYQQKMQEFISAKQELLQARLDEANQTILEQKQAAVQLIETQIEAAEQASEIAIGKVEAILENTKLALNTAIQQVINSLPQSLSASINAEIGNVKVNFEANFKADYAQYINSEYWNGLNVTAA